MADAIVLRNPTPPIYILDPAGDRFLVVNKGKSQQNEDKFDIDYCRYLYALRDDG